MKSLREQAMDFLARREHSRYELKRKLLAKNFLVTEVDELLACLTEEGLQSDERYAETYVRSRTTAGFGPRRIEYELQQRGVAHPLITQFVALGDSKWWSILTTLWQRKFSDSPISDHKMYAKQLRFLLQRGFEPKQIHQLLKAKDMREHHHEVDG